MTTALLIARLLLGGALFAHGAQKLFGWFGGYGVKGTGGFMESLGFRPGPMFAIAAGLGETGGGLLTALGLGGPIGPALIIMVMIVAIRLKPSSVIEIPTSAKNPMYESYPTTPWSPSGL